MNKYPSLSFAICVCNEINEIQQLISQIKTIVNKEQDEIVILFDTQNGTKDVKEYLDKINIELEFEGIQFHRIYHPLNNDFATHKNFLLKNCSKEFLILLDSDELFGEHLEKNIHELIYLNKDIDVILFPRENFVEGASKEELEKLYGWNVDEFGKINYPDLQERSFKNNKGIYFQNKVHERLTGYKTISHIPINIEGWCIV